MSVKDASPGRLATFPPGTKFFDDNSSPRAELPDGTICNPLGDKLSNVSLLMAFEVDEAEFRSMAEDWAKRFARSIS